MIEKLIETLLFRSRWILAPFYLGLVAALIVLLFMFGKKFVFVLIPSVYSGSSTDLILSILGLIDIVLIANLLLIIIFSGYENFVSKIDMVKNHVDRPEWMGKVDFAGLKIKVIGSIVAISSIELLKIFIYISERKPEFIGDNLWEAHTFWLIMIHLTFVISGVLFAVMERIMHPPHAHAEEEHK